MNEWPRSAAALLVARLFLAAVFLFSGVAKAADWSGAVAEFEGVGLPAPGLAVAATIAVQVFAGLAVAIGWRTRMAALGLAGFTTVATLIGHPFWAFEGAEFTRQLTIALEHLGIVGGFILLAAFGPGRFSAEHAGPEA